ncbi:hypothetical protein J2129_000871 [Methanofollis sp. W23]|nr:hypothetical protein [Methanofollis sp. W23]
MIVDVIYIQNHIDWICDIVETGKEIDRTVPPSMRKELAEKIQTDLLNYFDEISSGSGIDSIDFDLDFFGVEDLIERILVITQRALGMTDRECSESEDLQDKLSDALDEANASCSYDEIITRISQAGSACVRSHFHLSEDQGQILFRILEKELDEGCYESVREIYGDEIESSSSEYSLDMDSFDENELTQIIVRDIEEKFHGTTVPEDDQVRLKTQCTHALQILCRELDRFACYENLA